MDQLKPVKPGFIIAIVLAVLPTLGSLAFETYISFNPNEDFPLTLLQGALFISWVILFIFALPFACWKKKGKYMIFWPTSILLFWLSTLFLRAYPIPHYIHFAAKYSEYQAIVSRSPHTQHSFDWGGTGLASTINSDRTLIYDPKDLIILENQKKNALWQREEKQHNPSRIYPSHWLVTHLFWNHYYLVEEFHQA